MNQSEFTSTPVMRVLLFLTALAVFATAANAAAITSTTTGSYYGYSVLRLEPSPSSKSWLKHVVIALDLDVWAKRPGSLDVMVHPEILDTFTAALNKRGVKTTVLIEDVQALVDQEKAAMESRPRMHSRGVDHTTYRSFAEMMTELDGLETAYPDLISTFSPLTTHEGRPLRVAKVSSGGADTRPAIWIDCGIHSREWVSSATCMYILDTLTSQYGKDPAVTEILDANDFYILAATNPDGYEYSQKTFRRFWRKNRVPYGNCFGADPNRNFDSAFGGPGTSNDPCSNVYHGPYAFSEVESQVVRDVTKGLGDRLKGFFTLHSFSQFWIIPYGYTFDKPETYAEMMRVTKIGADALTAVYGTKFTIGSISEVVYEAAGASTDWAYDSLKVGYSCALELRDTGTYGFLLPEELILPTAQETWVGLTAAINAINK